MLVVFMLNKELPLKSIKNINKYFSFEGTCADIFEFEPEKGKKYVYKEIRQDSRVMRNVFENSLDFEKEAFSMKKIYGILKEYFGDRIAKTFYIVSKDRNGYKCIMIIQEKIEGVVWDDMCDEDKFYDKAEKQIEEIEQIIKKADKDPRIEKMREELRSKKMSAISVDFGDILHSKNMIVDKNGDVKIIDW